MSVTHTAQSLKVEQDTGAGLSKLNTVICPNKMTERRLTPSIRMRPCLLLKLPGMSITSPQRKARYKNANVQLAPAGTREGKLHAPAVRGDVLLWRGRHTARLV